MKKYRFTEKAYDSINKDTVDRNKGEIDLNNIPRCVSSISF